jgi:hypothetical protein
MEPAAAAASSRRVTPGRVRRIRSSRRRPGAGLGAARARQPEAEHQQADQRGPRSGGQGDPQGQQEQGEAASRGQLGGQQSREEKDRGEGPGGQDPRGRGPRAPGGDQAGGDEQRGRRRGRVQNDRHRPEVVDRGRRAGPGGPAQAGRGDPGAPHGDAEGQREEHAGAGAQGQQGQGVPEPGLRAVAALGLPEEGRCGGGHGQGQHRQGAAEVGHGHRRGEAGEHGPRAENRDHHQKAHCEQRGQGQPPAVPPEAQQPQHRHGRNQGSGGNRQDPVHVLDERADARGRDEPAEAGRPVGNGLGGAGEAHGPPEQDQQPGDAGRCRGNTPESDKSSIPRARHGRGGLFAQQ